MSRLARTCGHCSVEFIAASYRARYCSDRCRNAAAHARRRGIEPTSLHELVPELVQPVSVLAAVRRELEAAGTDATSLGQLALTLARVVDLGDALAGGALAAVSKELRSTLAALRPIAVPSDDVLSKMRSKRAKGPQR